MTLTVEDGSLVSGADSYISLADARSYCANRGIALSDDDSAAEIQLRRAFDYLELKRAYYKGTKVDPAQLTQWPRTGVVIEGAEIDTVTIPVELKYAQVQYAVAINSGLDLLPTASGDRFVTREKIGQIETEYSSSLATSGIPIVRIADQLLEPLLNTVGMLSVERA